jgi:uncharacterized membrane protein
LTKIKEARPGVRLSKAVAVILLTLVALFAGCSKLPVEHQVVEARNGEIRIPVSEVNDGKVHFYTYRESGKRINFFVRTDGTGHISTYFDACFSCYKHKKGYRCEGTDLICNECNEKFRLADERWESNKGCSPIALTSSIGKDFVIVKVGDIEAGERLF